MAGVSTQSAPTSYRTCNVRVDPMDLSDAVDRIIGMAKSGTGHAVHLCNAYTLALAARDTGYAAVIDRGDLNLTDGMPLAWLGRRLGFRTATKARPRGCDVFVQTVVAGQGQGVRHYLYGGTPDVVRNLEHALRALAPSVEIVGVEAPPFRPLEDHERRELVSRITASGAHVVWVGLGTPKQDVFVDEFSDSVNATLIAVGAAFDFLAGAKTEAPKWMQQRGVEWVHRLASEPGRLWKRYLVGNVTFIAGAVRTGARRVV